MMRLLRRLFSGKTKEPSSSNPIDMRSTPVDNPLDFREDGSIREGDPAWDFLQEMLNNGTVGIATQNDDGTWRTDIRKKEPLDLNLPVSDEEDAEK